MERTKKKKPICTARELDWLIKWTNLKPLIERAKREGHVSAWQKRFDACAKKCPKRFGTMESFGRAYDEHFECKTFSHAYTESESNG